VLFTDGITEANSPAGEEFGDDRLIETIRTHATEPASQLTRVLADTVSAWAGGAVQDDATLIVLVMR
jgi:sigma-B regulation protein RsbU (phosphoserine phosphatase)